LSNHKFTLLWSNLKELSKKYYQINMGVLSRVVACLIGCLIGCLI
jgi:hypothetical protein